MEKDYPHVGSHIEDLLKKKHMSKLTLAQKLGVTGSGVQNYLKNDSLQFRIIWNISKQLQTNILAELASSLPIDYVTEREKILQERVRELESENEKLNWMLDRMIQGRKD